MDLNFQTRAFTLFLFFQHEPELLHLTRFHGLKKSPCILSTCLCNSNNLDSVSSSWSPLTCWWTPSWFTDSWFLVLELLLWEGEDIFDVATLTVMVLICVSWGSCTPPPVWGTLPWVSRRSLGEGATWLLGSGVRWREGELKTTCRTCQNLDFFYCYGLSAQPVISHLAEWCCWVDFVIWERNDHMIEQILPLCTCSLS